MDKKKFLKNLPQEDLRGFKEFIEGEPHETNFLPKPSGNSIKKEVSFEHFTFLTNDAERLVRIKNLLSSKLPFSAKFEQGHRLLDEQKAEIHLVKTKLFAISDKDDSPYRKSLGEIFDSFFAPPTPNTTARS